MFYFVGLPGLHADGRRGAVKKKGSVGTAPAPDHRPNTGGSRSGRAVASLLHDISHVDAKNSVVAGGVLPTNTPQYKLLAFA